MVARYDFHQFNSINYTGDETRGLLSVSDRIGCISECVEFVFLLLLWQEIHGTIRKDGRLLLSL